MPYTVSRPPARIKKLPKHAQEIWVSAYNSAFKQYNGNEERANKVAWGAVKRSYKQVDGKWVKKAEQPHGPHECVCPKCGETVTVETDVKCNTVKCPECGTTMRGSGQGERRTKMKYLPMSFSKISKREGVMQFETTVTDTEWDSQDERLTYELFEDFIRRENEKKARLGDEHILPYLSVSHYRRPLGDVDEYWVQGNRFKTRGIFYDDKYGRALFRALLEERSGAVEVEDPIRVSIGFWPHEARDEGGRLAYTKGEFDHQAATRVPINERTAFDEVIEKGMAITKKEDATSIVGENLAEELDLDERSRMEKGDLKDGMVIKSEDESSLTLLQEEVLKSLLEEEGEDSETIEKAQWDYAYKKALPDSAYLWVEHGKGCEKKDGKTPQKCRHLPYKEKSGKTDCGHLRAAIQAIGGARTGKPMSVPSGVLSKAKRLYARNCAKKKAIPTDEGQPWVSLPYGGAMSIGDAVNYMKGQEADWELRDDMRLFSDVVENILKSEEIEDKKSAISRAVNELNGMLKEDVMSEKEEKSSVLNLLEGIKESDAADETKGDQVETAPEDESSLDALFGVLKSVVQNPDLDRAGKIAGAFQCLKTMGAACDRIILESTPRTEADVIADITEAASKAAVEKVIEAIKPFAEKLTILEATMRANPVGTPERKGLTVVGKAQTESDEPIKKGSVKWYARINSGLDPETGKPIF